MDPLAELVKLDPKRIGVGQYQHDVDQNALKRTLDDVVRQLREQRRRRAEHRAQAVCSPTSPA